MSRDVNKAMIIGTVGKDPEIRRLQNGERIATFSVATNDGYFDKTVGKYRDKTEWHRVCVMNDIACGYIEKHVKKGTRIYVEGQFQTSKWKDSKGEEKTLTQIFVGKFKGEVVNIGKKNEEDVVPNHKPPAVEFTGEPMKDDELPF